MKLAQVDLRERGLTQDDIFPILYRPFDVRYTYYTGQSRGFLCMPRREVMRHMLNGKNLALHTCRQIVSEKWEHCLVTNGITDDCYVSNRTRERGYAHPLYLSLIDDSDDPRAYQERRANIDSRIQSVLKDAHGETLTPEDIFRYIYAVLYAPSYREKYAESLRREFPRVPFTSDRELFAEIASLGARLTELHLLTSPELDAPTCRFPVQGEMNVAKTKAQGFRYDPNTQRMYINKTQFFGPISEEIYRYRIGGYQVCEKWLKDRKDRRLKLEDIQTYCRIVTAIGHTIRIQEQLDDLYPEVEKDLVSIPAE